MTKRFAPYKVAFTLRQITRRKMVIYLLEKNIFDRPNGKSTAYYAQCEHALMPNELNGPTTEASVSDRQGLPITVPIWFHVNSYALVLCASCWNQKCFS